MSSVFAGESRELAIAVRTNQSEILKTIVVADSVDVVKNHHKRSTIPRGFHMTNGASSAQKILLH